jgi:hypothetical protein
MRLLTSFGGRAAEYSGTGHGVYAGISLKIVASLSTMSSSEDHEWFEDRRMVASLCDE